jgi:hypothetical protein
MLVGDEIPIGFPDLGSKRKRLSLDRIRVSCPGPISQYFRYIFSKE